MKTKVSKKTAGVPAVRKKAQVEKASKVIAAVAAVDPQALLARAIDKNLPIETMERLLAMRDKMKAEWARDQFFAALAGFQSDCPIIDKKKTANIRSRKGEDSSFSYKYAAIEDLAEPVKHLFVRWGLSWTLKPDQTKETVTAHVHVHHKDGHEEVTSFTVPIDPDSYMADPQKAGAALTYASRYAFKAAFGIQARGEDNEQKLEGDGRRAPIHQPQARPATAAASAAVPVHHEEKPASGEYTQIMQLLSKSVKAPGTSIQVRDFTSAEAIDFKAMADQAKTNQPELVALLA